MPKKSSEEKLIEKLEPFLGTYHDRCSVAATPSRRSQLIGVLEELLKHVDRDEYKFTVFLFQVARFIETVTRNPDIITARILNLARLGLECREERDLLDEFLVKHLPEIMDVKTGRAVLDSWQEIFISVMSDAWWSELSAKLNKKKE